VIKTSFLAPARKVVFPLSLQPKENPVIVPTPPREASTDSRLAVIETTATYGKGLLAAVVFGGIGLFSFFYINVIPDKVEQGIAGSNHLNTKFSEVREDVKKLDGRFEQLLSSIRPLVSPKIIAAALKDSASADLASLPAALTEIRNLLAVARDMRVPVRGKDYNDVAKPLFAQYLSSKPPLKQDIWKTLVDLANTRTKTDSVLHPLSADAKNEKRDGDVDLSERTVWQKTIFHNAKIKISKPEQDLTLNDVRFLDSEFQSDENETCRRLLESVLESTGPEVTATVTRFKVLPPTGEIKKIARSDQMSPRPVIALVRSSS
jgi:hypothetical protein